MDLSRTTSALWTSFSSHARRKDLVRAIVVGGGMHDVCDRVLWAGGAACFVMAAFCERVLQADVSVETGTGWQGMWHQRWVMGQGACGVGWGGMIRVTVVIERVTRMFGSTTLGSACSTLESWCSIVGTDWWGGE